MQLGLFTACLPWLTLDEVADWAASAGYDALEVAAWSSGGDHPHHATHLVRWTAGPSTASASGRCSPSTAWPLRSELLREQPHRRPGRAPARINGRSSTLIRCCARSTATPNKAPASGTPRSRASRYCAKASRRWPPRSAPLSPRRWSPGSGCARPRPARAWAQPA